MSDATERLARLLIDARESGVAIEPPVGDLIPESVAAAELVDDRVAELTGSDVLGWKIGCTSAVAQQMLGSDEPFAGRIYRIAEGGVTLAEADLMGDPMIEGEFAFRFAKAIEPSNPPASRAEVLDAVDAVMPAIEFVGGRYSSFVGTPLNLIIADAGSNSLLVIGDPNTDIDPASLADRTAFMAVDEVVTGEGSGAQVLGDPVNALLWLISNLAARGITITPGQIVTTGTATQLAPLANGSTALATMAGLGSVSATRA